MQVVDEALELAILIELGNALAAGRRKHVSERDDPVDARVHLCVRVERRDLHA